MTEETYKLLYRIEQRPGMYVGENKLKCISAFLSGYILALQDIDSKIEIGITYEFFEWVADKLGYSESTGGWANMILAKTLNLTPNKHKWEEFDTNATEDDHRNSIQNFYKLLREYKAQ